MNAPQGHLHRGDSEAPRLLGAARCLYQKLVSDHLLRAMPSSCRSVEGRDPEVTDRWPPRLAAVIVRLSRCQDQLQDQQREAVKKSDL